MIALALLVIFSPVLVFKGLTLETLWAFCNVHPFWFMFLVSAVCKTDFVSIVKNYDKERWFK